MQVRILYIIAAATVFIGALFAGYYGSGGMQQVEKTALPRSAESVVDEKLVEAFAPQFKTLRIATEEKYIEDSAFLNPEGKEIGWQNFKGKYLLVNFWATWCGPCVRELPSLEKLRDQYAGSDLEIIAIAVDYNKDLKILQEFLDYREIGHFALYFDHQSDVRANVPMRGIPTSYLIDPKGQILYVFEGDADWVSPESIAFFEALLSQKQ